MPPCPEEAAGLWGQPVGDNSGVIYLASETAQVAASSHSRGRSSSFDTEDVHDNGSHRGVGHHQELPDMLGRRNARRNEPVVAETVCSSMDWS